MIYVTGEVAEEQKERLLYIAGRCPDHLTLHGFPHGPHEEDVVIVKKGD